MVQRSSPVRDHCWLSFPLKKQTHMYPRWSLLPPPTDSQRVLWSSRKQHARETHSQTPVGCDSTHENRPFWTDALSSNATLFQLPGRGGGCPCVLHIGPTRPSSPPHAHTHPPPTRGIVRSRRRESERQGAQFSVAGRSVTHSD